MLMCGSKNLQVQRHSALVLGNVAQDEEQREHIGLRGGVEGERAKRASHLEDSSDEVARNGWLHPSTSKLTHPIRLACSSRSSSIKNAPRFILLGAALFLLCEYDDEAVQANSLWALSNLGWHPLNQERIGRYMEAVMKLCESKYLPVQTNAVCCLANALYFHDRNRARVGAIDGAVEMLTRMLNGDEFSEPIIENALRAIVSLTYVDEIGVPLAKEGQLIPVLVKLCYSTAHLIQKYSAMALLNLSVHDVLKLRILNDGGVEALAGMQGSESAEVSERSERALRKKRNIYEPLRN